jgi:hypothetical protein
MNVNYKPGRPERRKFMFLHVHAFRMDEPGVGMNNEVGIPPVLGTKKREQTASIMDRGEGPLARFSQIPPSFVLNQEKDGAVERKTDLSPPHPTLQKGKKRCQIVMPQKQKLSVKSKKIVVPFVFQASLFSQIHQSKSTRLHPPPSYSPSPSPFLILPLLPSSPETRKKYQKRKKRESPQLRKNTM